MSNKVRWNISYPNGLSLSQETKGSLLRVVSYLLVWKKVCSLYKDCCATVRMLMGLKNLNSASDYFH